MAEVEALLQLAGVPDTSALLAKMKTYEPDMSSDVDAKIRPLLIKALLNPPSIVVENDCTTEPNTKVVSCVAHFALNTAAPWPELWDAMFSEFRKQDKKKDAPLPAKEVCYNVLIVVSRLATKFDALVTSHIVQLERCLRTCLKDARCMYVRLAAFDCAANINSMINQHLPDNYFPLKHIARSVIDAIQDMAKCGQWEELASIGKKLCWMMEYPGPFLHRNNGDKEFPDMFEVLLEIFQQPTISILARTEVGSALTLLLETVDTETIQFLKKNPGLRKRIFDAFCTVLENAGFDSEEDWATTYAEIDAGEVEADGVDHVKKELDTISQIHKDDKKFVQWISKKVTSNAASKDAKLRFAATQIVMMTCEGQSSALASTGQLGKLYQTMLALASDENMYVRSGAFQAVAELLSNCIADISPKLQMDALPVCLSTCKDSSVPRVQCDALFPIRITFDKLLAEYEPEDPERQHTPLLEDIAALISTIGQAAIDSEYYFFKRDSLQTMSAIISVGAEHMVPFVDELVPLFHTFLTNTGPTSPNKDSTQHLPFTLNYAIECTTILASVVGYEPFKPFAAGVADFIATELQKDFATWADTRLKFLLRGWTCMVDCMGDHAVPYLEAVMPKLLQLASLNCDLERLEEFKPGDELPPNTPESQYMVIRRAGAGEDVYRIKVADTEAKELGITIIDATLSALGSKLGKWIPAVATVAVTDLSFSTLETIRTDCAELLAPIARALMAGYPGQELSLVDFVQGALQKLVEAGKIENTLETAEAFIIAGEELLMLAPTNLQDIDQLRSWFENYNLQLEPARQQAMDDDSVGFGNDSDDDGEEDADDGVEDALPAKRGRK